MKYKVAGIVFEVLLEDPYREMEYSPVVLERIERASRGEAGLDIRPTRAGDDVPHRTLIQSREELLPGASGLDLSQYAPFAISTEGEAGAEKSQPPVFTLRVQKGLENAPKLGKLLAEVHEQSPYYSIYESAEGTQYTLDEDLETGKPAAILAMSPDFSEGVMYADASQRPYGVVFQMSTALMIMFTYNAALREVMLFHASVIGLDGRANIFLGKSGTGKSTHSRLWLENIPGTELLNDDNPALGFDAAGQLIVYGTPWSGKTPCYRNICAPVNAIVRLDQAPENSITQEYGLNAYASLLGSVSSVRWNRAIMDALSRSVEKAIGSAKVFHLSCLPVPSAAHLCADTITPK
ncbi:MAG: hypothetical protein IJ151_02085 [Bacteroidales bacterium]|nr:hypothetical protein [Bacteroidales bacterium]